MRSAVLIMAGALMLPTAPLLANPLPRAAWLPDAGAVEAIPIHHKPGHHGGPPWLRGGRDRGDWRDGRYDERTYTVCRNTYRTYYDPYYGEYVRRRVRICD